MLFTMKNAIIIYLPVILDIVSQRVHSILLSDFSFFINLG